MTESTPPEGQQPLTQAQIRQLQRDLTEQVLDRAESDPEFRQLLLDDPELAMREANFPAAQQLAQQGAPQEEEVTGQRLYGRRRGRRRRYGYYGYGYGYYGYGHCRRWWLTW
jgi:hypothetical protein